MQSIVQENELESNQYLNKLIFNENQYCGLESLISMTKKQVNISTMFFKLQTTFQSEIQQTGMEPGSQFTYVSNCHDLWRYLPYKVKEFHHYFEKADYQIMKKVLLVGRLHLQYHLLKECKKKMNQRQNHTIFKKRDLILKKYKSNAQKSPINEEIFQQFTKKVHCFENIEKLKNIFLKLNIENVEKNDEILTKFLKEVLQFIYLPIREKQGYKKKSAVSIYLMILYLKISLKTKKWLYVLESKMNVNSMFMGLLGRKNGILKLIRYFQDAPSEVIQREYVFTKESLLKNR